jgi:hypothetical protein
MSNKNSRASVATSRRSGGVAEDCGIGSDASLPKQISSIEVRAAAVARGSAWISSLISTASPGGNSVEAAKTLVDRRQKRP